MKPRFAYHVFSHDGSQYRTTQIGGLSSGEARELEQFFFGQTNDPAYFAGLRQEPGVIWRRAGSGKALTRIRPGKPDSNGRATLRFETILLASASALPAGHISRLVCGAWSFFEDRVEVTPATGAVGELHPQRISDVLISLAGAARIVRQAEGFSLADVDKIIAHLASDAEFSLAYKSLNPQAPVTVNLVSGTVMESTMAAVKPIRNKPAQGAQRGRTVYAESSGTRASPLIVGLLCVVVILQIFSLLRSKTPPTSGSLDELQAHVLTRIESVDNKVENLHEELKGSESRVNAKFAAATKHTDDVKTSIEGELATLDKRLANFGKRTTGDLERIAKKLGEATERAADVKSFIAGEFSRLDGKIADGFSQNGIEIGKLAGDIKKIKDDLGALLALLED